MKYQIVLKEIKWNKESPWCLTGKLSEYHFSITGANIKSKDEFYLWRTYFKDEIIKKIGTYKTIDEAKREASKYLEKIFNEIVEVRE